MKKGGICFIGIGFDARKINYHL